MLDCHPQRHNIATNKLCSHIIDQIPLTSKVAEWDVDPALFDAVQVYSPACRAATASMVSCITRFPALDTAMSDCSGLIGSPLKAQEISNGKSPLMTAH